MGFVLDSGVLIAAERDARPVSELLASIEHEHGETDIVLSSITVIELEHGLHRAQTTVQAGKRREYPDTVFAAIPVEPFTREMAQLAAKLDAEARQTGRTIPFLDLLRGIASEHWQSVDGNAVLPSNSPVRHRNPLF
jgi:tRNA(fMet)-specific endonuclease VapC